MSEQRAQPGPQPAQPPQAGGQPQQARQNAPQQARPPAPQQGRPPRADLSRDELRAHLANVESQIKSALRIIASESKGTQQAHSALRADLSSALVRLQADMNSSSSDLSAKVDRLGAEVSFLSRQRRIGRVIFLTFGMTLSFILGVLVIVSWLLIKEGGFQNTGIPVPIEEMFERGASPTTAAPQQTPPAVLDQRPTPPPSAVAPGPQSAAPQVSSPASVAAPAQSETTSRPKMIGILPPPVQQQPLAAPAQPAAAASVPAQQAAPPQAAQVPATPQRAAAPSAPLAPPSLPKPAVPPSTVGLPAQLLVPSQTGQ